MALLLSSLVEYWAVLKDIIFKRSSLKHFLHLRPLSGSISRSVLSLPSDGSHGNKGTLENGAQQICTECVGTHGRDEGSTKVAPRRLCTKAPGVRVLASTPNKCWLMGCFNNRLHKTRRRNKSVCEELEDGYAKLIRGKKNVPQSDHVGVTASMLVT